MSKEPKLVTVEWMDAVAYTDRYRGQRKPKKNLIKCTTVGYLVDWDQDAVLICAEKQKRYSEAPRYERDMHAIPRVCVVRIRQLGKGKDVHLH